MLIDGKNILYRAIFVKTRDSPVEVFFRVILSAIRKSNANFYHIFWDCPRSETWRRQIMPTYKANRHDSDPEIGEAIGINLRILQQICPMLGFTTYGADKLEADDLIWAWSSVHQPTDIVILSSDHDLLQIPFRFDTARQLKPGKSIDGVDWFEKPAVNPVLQKCITGDKSDNIPGYHGIGPKKSEKMLLAPGGLQKFLSENDPKQFYFNLNIVDLAQCRMQMRAQYTVINGSQVEPKFDLQSARGILSQYKMYPQLHDLDWSSIHENALWQSTSPT